RGWGALAFQMFQSFQSFHCRPQPASRRLLSEEGGRTTAFPHSTSSLHASIQKMLLIVRAQSLPPTPARQASLWASLRVASQHAACCPPDDRTIALDWVRHSLLHRIASIILCAVRCITHRCCTPQHAPHHS